MNKYNRYIFLGIVFFAVTISSCKVLKNTGNKEISDEAKFKFEYSFAEAGKQRMLGNSKEAIDIYMYCLELNPKSAASNYFISTIYARNKKLETALAYAKNAVKLNSTKIWYRILLADILKSLNRFEEAENAYRQIIKTNPTEKYIYYDLINILLEQNKLEQTLNIYKKKKKTFSYEEDNALAIYDLLMTLKRKEKALDELKTLSKNFPENIKYRALIAEYYLTVNDIAKAKIMYDKMLADEPNNISVRLSYASYTKFVKDKEGFYENAFFIIQSLDTELKTKVRIILSGEKNMFTDEQYENLLKELISAHPNERIAQTLFAEYLLKNDNKNEAAKYIRKAVDIDNSDFNLVLALFEIDYDIKDFENLYKDSQKLEEIYPNQSKVFFYNGLASYKLKKYEEAKKTLDYGKDLVIDNNSLKAQYWFYLGETYSALLQADKSKKSFENALKFIEIVIKNISKDNSKIFDRYGDILFKNKKVDEAVIYWKKAYKLNPKSKILEEKIKNKKI